MGKSGKSYRFKRYMALLCLSFVFLVILILTSFIFTIKHVEVTGTDRLNGITRAKNNLIFLVSTNNLSQELLKLNPDIESIEIIKKLPDTIVLNVKKEPPIGLFIVANGYYYLSKNGKVLQKVRNIEQESRYAILSYYQKFDYNSYKPGDTIEESDLQYALFFLNEFLALGASIVKLDINGSDMLVLKTDDTKTYIFTTVREKTQQLEEFKVLYKKFKIEKTGFKTIDFRFDKPVVTF